MASDDTRQMRSNHKKKQKPIKEKSSSRSPHSPMQATKNQAKKISRITTAIMIKVLFSKRISNNSRLISFFVYVLSLLLSLFGSSHYGSYKIFLVFIVRVPFFPRFVNLNFLHWFWVFFFVVYSTVTLLLLLLLESLHLSTLNWCSFCVRMELRCRPRFQPVASPNG